MADILIEVARALQNSRAHELATRFLRDVPGAPPVTQSIHILGIAIIVASALLLSLRILGAAAPGQAVSEMQRRLQPWFWSAVPVMVATGLVFVLARPMRYFTNPIFGLKLALFLPALACAGYIFRADTSNANVAPKLVAISGLLLWITIILAGRWIAYVDYLIPFE